MSKPRNLYPLTCVLAGGTPLVTRCARFLQGCGHRVISVYTDDPGVRQACADLEGAGFYTLDQVSSIPAGPPCDVLFSIANEKILSRDVIFFPAQFSVNYHDSLLPAFAGRNASAWSIYHRQKQHGITWHVMAERADAGDILVQQRVAISEEDTAFALNTRCFDAAFHGFELLVSQLETGAVQRTPMDLSRRTFFSESQRLPDGGLVDWNQPAEQITAAVRATDFGLYPSPLGRVKACLGGQWLVIQKAVPENRTAPGTPGDIVEFAPGRLVVAAGEGQVVVQAVADLAGNPLDLGALQRSAPKAMDRFSPRAVEAAGRLRGEAAQHDAFWAEAYKGRRYPDLDQLGLRAPASAEPPEAWTSLAFPVSPAWAQALGMPLDQVFALLWMILLWRITGEEVITLDVPSALPQALEGPLRAWARPEWPLTVAFEAACSFQEAKARFVQAVQKAAGRQPVFYDQVQFGFGQKSPLVFQMAADLGAVKKDDARKLVFAPDQRKRLYRLFYHPSAAEKKSLILLKKLFQRLARQAVHHPRQSLSTLRLYGRDDEKRQCLARPPRFAARPFVPVYAQVRKIMRRYPGRVAVHSEKREMTYRELEVWVDRLMVSLFEAGVRKGGVVVLFMERDAAFIAGLLAVLGLGAAYLPLDLKQPQQRVKEIVLSARAALVLTDQGPEQVPPGLEVPVLNVSGGFFDAPPASGRPVAEVNEADPAYVIYTSGSTGSPKGTVVSQGALSRFMRVNIRQHRVTRHDRILQLCSLSFDASVEEIFSALLTGAALYLRTEAMLYAFSHFLQQCREWKLTIIGLFPAHFQDILDAMEQTRSFPKTIRLVTTGGEALQEADIRRWQSFFKSRGLKPPRLVNVYGLTETTIASLTCDLTRRPLRQNSVPIGRPLPGTLLHILDRYGQPVPTGIPGEIHLGGVGVALGYLHQEQFTAERFLRDPFQKGQRMFKTGDFGKFAADGAVMFLGRKDRQIKSLGYRIELEEIKFRLRQLPGVRKAAVVLHQPGQAGPGKITAFIVPEAAAGEAGLTPAPEDWVRENTARLAEFLPAYMLPSAFFFTAEMPLDPNGKIDLKQLNASLRLEKKAGAAPEADAAQVMRRLWEDVLPGFEGPRRDHFFEAGGDSVAAVEFIARLEERTGIALTLEDIFFHPRLESLIQAALGKSKTQARARLDSASLPKDMIARLQVVNQECPLPKASETSLMVVGNAGGPLPPIFWCFNAMGHEPAALAQALGSRQPLYGMFSGGLLLPGPELEQQIAGHLAEEIMAIHPQGPCRLGGNCRGAGVMLETARRLMEKGRAIAGLCLLEYFHPALYQVPFAVQLLYGRESELKAYEPFGWGNEGWEKPFKVTPVVRWTRGAHGQFFSPENCGELAGQVADFFHDQT